MKTITITISSDSIHVDAIGATLPEIYRTVHGLHHNLSGAFSKPALTIDENNQMVVKYEAPPVKLGGEPAVLQMEINSDGFPAGGKVDTNGETESHIIKCLEYILHVLSKELLAIATRLIGDDPAVQEEWIERVINKNII